LSLQQTYSCFEVEMAPPQPVNCRRVPDLSRHVSTRRCTRRKLQT